MRVNIDLDKALIRRIDEAAGPRGRSAFVREAIEKALDQKLRLEDFRSAAGSILDEGHEWDADPGEWVRRQRFGGSGHVG